MDIYVHSSAMMTKSRAIANNLFKKTAGMRSFQGTMRLCVEYSYLSIFKFLLGIIVLPDTDQRTLLRTCLSTTRLRPCVEDDLLGGLVRRRQSLSRNDKKAIAVRPLGQRRVFWINREHCRQRAGGTYFGLPTYSALRLRRLAGKEARADLYRVRNGNAAVRPFVPTAVWIQRI